jgi:kinesin family protein 18/19
MQVYNETLRDLLDPKGALPLREDDKGVTVSDLSIHKPQTAEELFDMLATGNQNRTQHPTDANAQVCCRAAARRRGLRIGARFLLLCGASPQ